MRSASVLAPEMFDSVHDRLPLHRADEFYCMVGPSPVLITSVHGFDHLRDGKSKPADAGTLELSYLTACAGRSSWLAVGATDLDDSNHHRCTAFKAELASFVKAHRIQLIVDIHASHAYRPYDVDVGSLNQKTWLGKMAWRDILFEEFRNCGFLATDNQVFAGAGSTPDAETIVAFSYALGIPSVQLEISSAYLAGLDTRLACHLRSKLIFGLSKFIGRVVGAGD